MNATGIETSSSSILWCLPGVSKTPVLCAARTLLPKLLYDTTKSSAEFIGSWGYWTGKQVVAIAGELGQTIGLPNLNLYNRFVEETPITFTETTTPQSSLVKTFDPDATINPEFKTTDLIGPALFIALCGQQALKNGRKAARHLRMLSQRKLSETVQYQPNSPSEVPVQQTKTYTLRKLVWSTFLDIAGTAAWSAAGMLTKIGIADALIDAGLHEDKAALIANSLAIAAVATPLLLKQTYRSVNSLVHWLRPEEPYAKTPQFKRQVVHSFGSNGKLIKTLIRLPIN